MRRAAAGVIERRPPLERQVVDQERGEVLDVGRTRRQVDEILDARAPRPPRSSAPVGFGAAAGIPPNAAQVPIAIVAAALPHTSRAMSSADSAADRAVGSVRAGRNRAFDDGDVCAGALLDGAVAVLLATDAPPPP